jgi:NAD+ kinase
VTGESSHPFCHVGVLAHPQRPETFPLADQIAHWLREQGVVASVLTEWDQEGARADALGWDLVISIGGDGNVLRAARVCAVRGVPVLGVNMGRMGFLTEMSPSDWEEGLAAVLRGDYWLEDRLMIAAEWWHGGDFMCREEALNEAVVSRGVIARLVEFETYIDGAWTTTYRGDGLIVATPTGSTAYSLAVGGPILPPELRNLVLVPVAAHMCMDRPMVLSGDAVIEIVVHRRHQAILTVDGRLVGELEDGDRVVVRAADHVSHFVRTGEHTYFYRSILDRMEPNMDFMRGRQP